MRLSIVFGVAVVLLAGPAVSRSVTNKTRATEDDDVFRLPEDFIMGAGTSSYQVEGAWNEGGKSENVFDYYYHKSQPGRPNADTTCDSYHQYKEDVKMLKALKMQMYRFSISWARILPNGDTSVINQAGIDYYNNLINELLANGIKPLVTIYHFDHPQVLETKFGGWLSPQMIDHFENYARVVLDNFADRVDTWITINEPHMHCFIVYNSASVPPAIPNAGVGEYQCIHNEIVAQAKVYRMFKSNPQWSRNGTRMGMTIETFFAAPSDTLYANIEAAQRYNEFEMGIQMDPLVFGDYPAVVREYVAAQSKREGLNESRLPPFTDEEKQLIRGTTDFIGLNAYFGRIVHDGYPSYAPHPSWQVDMNVIVDGPEFSTAFSLSTPWALRGALQWLKGRYNNYPVLITENGVATSSVNPKQDIARAAYHSAYLREIMRAIREDGCKVIGMTAWSLLDGYEWGRDRKFGLVDIDYNSTAKTRSLKESSSFYIQLMTERKVPLVTLPPDSTTPSTASTGSSSSTPSTSGSQVTRPLQALVFLVATSLALLGSQQIPSHTKNCLVT